MAIAGNSNGELEKKLWQTAEKLRGPVDPSEYKDFALGLLFLKSMSDSFEARRQELEESTRDEDSRYYTEDADGVAFAAIQGLSEKLDDKDERIDDLEADLDAKDVRINDQQDRIKRLESKIDNKDVALDALRNALDDKDERIEDLEAENEQLRERNAELEDRLATVEAELGIDATASQQGVADD